MSVQDMMSLCLRLGCKPSLLRLRILLTMKNSRLLASMQATMILSNRCPPQQMVKIAEISIEFPIRYWSNNLRYVIMRITPVPVLKIVNTMIKALRTSLAFLS